jgi:hypothetical protein
MKKVEPEATVLLPWDADESDGWRTRGRERFEAAYAPEDAIFEQLIDETSAR